MCGRRENGELDITWYVNTREDIGDFVVFARSLNETRPSYTDAVSYIRRSARVSRLRAGQKYLLCVRALTSGGALRPYVDGQCRTVSHATPQTATLATLAVALLTLWLL